MAKNFREHNLDQRFLMPPDLRDWLPEGHLALFVSDVAGTLDLSSIMKAYVKEETRGGASYHPAMLVKLLVYGYCIGMPSSRRIERATHEDVGFRVLSGNAHPDHDTIAAFRRRFLSELSGLFVQVLVLCRRAGLIKLFPPQSAEAPVGRPRGGNGEGARRATELYAGGTSRSMGRR